MTEIYANELNQSSTSKQPMAEMQLNGGIF